MSEIVMLQTMVMNKRPTYADFVLCDIRNHGKNSADARFGILAYCFGFHDQHQALQYGAGEG